ncbi:hypothetical protein PR048_010365 [Dryococelus australis]|uniref:Uncharacterized protein n=1 Tax=Dryococelus australis TaxID=614101 RepID=A0ABQ9I3C9_9NEOP|nr:hypothetical protein PR048_010365 [Dryococelus australis]
MPRDRFSPWTRRRDNGTAVFLQQFGAADRIVLGARSLPGIIKFPLPSTLVPVEHGDEHTYVKNSILRNSTYTVWRGRSGVAVRRLAPNQGEPGGGVTPSFRAWGSCQTIPLVGGFSKGYSVSPAGIPFQFCSSTAFKSAQTSVNSLYELLAVPETPSNSGRRRAIVKDMQFVETCKIRLHGGAAVAEQLVCSPFTTANRVQSPAGSLPSYLHVGIVSDDAAGRRVFSGMFHFPRAFIPSQHHTPILTAFSPYTFNSNIPVFDSGNEFSCKRIVLLCSAYFHKLETLALNRTRKQQHGQGTQAFCLRSPILQFSFCVSANRLEKKISKPTKMAIYSRRKQMAVVNKISAYSRPK